MAMTFTRVKVLIEYMDGEAPKSWTIPVAQTAYQQDLSDVEQLRLAEAALDVSERNVAAARMTIDELLDQKDWAEASSTILTHLKNWEQGIDRVRLAITELTERVGKEPE